MKQPDTEESELRILLFRVEAWANFGWVKITMTINGNVVFCFEFFYQMQQRIFLLFRACVSRNALFVQSTDVCNANGIFVMATPFAMGTLKLQTSPRHNCTILENDVMVANVLKSSCSVKSTKIVHRHFTVRSIRRAVYYDFLYLCEWYHNDLVCNLFQKWKLLTEEIEL